MAVRHFHHALKIRTETCFGCTHCLKVCPTEAIRIRNGKAVLYENRCVDCGECFKACPVQAIYIDQDDFERIHTYEYRIALLPSIFVGQFSRKYDREQIYEAIKAVGFTHICEVEQSTGLLQEQINRYAAENPDKKPLISSFCPAIIRLIQVRFPSLVNNIMLLKPPLDITALYCRKKFTDEGINPARIGVFYITPCAAKIAAIKSPVGEDYSMITGVINMDFLFNRVYRHIKNNQSAEVSGSNEKALSAEAIRWSLTHGESDHFEGRSFAVDEIHNVIDFLEKVENDEIKNVDFLELRACDESCAGGALTTANRFLIAERLRSVKNEDAASAETSGKTIENYRDYLEHRIKIQEIKPRSIMKLDDNIETAMLKMDQVKEIMKLLPGTDCGICGSPTCQAFAKDIVQNEADIRQCIFIQKCRENTGEFTSIESLRLMKGIWGEEKF
ncbi:MAG TPA: [Fe-Fe] hydrogenase large subunit C-terminal domain-containing protein [Bacteroidales bacterium]|nr:[Fe-Fe] hydrogenase large subunit C-terminal domain-containing protein [Bacteroidales bacterium]